MLQKVESFFFFSFGDIHVYFIVTAPSIGADLRQRIVMLLFELIQAIKISPSDRLAVAVLETFYLLMECTKNARYFDRPLDGFFSFLIFVL